ncbi:hypothetical protein C8A03DRAFT_33314 [Achaetomium macrosporum]|uniref:Uncharacterized protein n=1 Tax=Achaetomium macrosporum TaxID=79813 RepID=A0AAN7CAX6_9PEZI|nr:hypothetical protein C8A03DRAFT_33314 [Achaetomium macrosporum]
MAPTTPSGSRGADASSNGSDENSLSSSSSINDHLAQALRDLARGEQTASTLEANLSSLESKVDAILASLGVSTEELDAVADGQDETQKKDDAKGASDGKKEGA